MFGELAQLSCVHDYEKTYWVLMEGDPTQDKLTQLERGIQLNDYRTLPAKARLIPQPKPACSTQAGNSPWPYRLARDQTP